jgi:aspartate kinase
VEAADGLLQGTPERERVCGRIEAIVNRMGSLCADAAEGGEEAKRRADELAAAGEDLSAELMAGALEAEGLQARVVDARTVVRTDGRFGGAIPRDEETARLVRDVVGAVLARGEVPVLQGFVGATDDGATTTLGRGGSDFTAAIVGAALGADEVSIWTDVDGVMSADPAQVGGARVLPELGYEEAVELAYFGAKAIHPAAAKHAAARDLSLRIRNSFRPQAPGTRIRPDRPRAPAVAAIAYRPGVTLIKVRSRPMFMAYGFLARTFEVLARHRLPVDLVATSHTSTAFTIDEREGLDTARMELSEFAEVEIVPDLATVSVIGQGLLRRPGIAARVFAALEGTPVQLISQAADVALSFLVDAGSAPDVVRRLHRDLIEDEERDG